jgi:radical SAM-linked protein
MKVRVRYSKVGKVRFVGNLDVTRIWERALRKSAIAVAYSTGFSPRPRLSFGLALPMAAESTAEYLDIELAADIEIDDLAERLTDAMPTGFDVLVVTEKLPGQVSLQEDVVACDWHIELAGIRVDAARQAVEATLAAEVLPLERERKGERRTDDVRGDIEQLEVLGPVESISGVALVARLATVGRALRPAELVSVVFPDSGDPVDVVRRLVRTEQWIERDGARRELLPLPAAVAVPTGTVGA